MSRRNPQGNRASGQSAADEEARGEADKIEVDDATLPEEPFRPEWRTPRFMRMRFNWGSPEERTVMASAHSAVEQALLTRFTEAYMIQAQIQNIVRTQVTVNDVPQFDARNNPVWQLNEVGVPIEDWSRLSSKQCEDLLGQIVMRQFVWAQEAGRMNGEALFAKAQFEERFAISYNESMGDTVDDRKASGNLGAAEERYHAVFLTMLSRRADNLVRSMERITSMLRDRLYPPR